MVIFLYFMGKQGLRVECFDQSLMPGGEQGLRGLSAAFHPSVMGEVGYRLVNASWFCLDWRDLLGFRGQLSAERQPTKVPRQPSSTV